MWWYFTCKHVPLFKIPYITCTFFTKFTYNEYIGPYVLLHVVSRLFASASPPPPEGEDAQTVALSAKYIIFQLIKFYFIFH